MMPNAFLDAVMEPWIEAQKKLMDSASSNEESSRDMDAWTRFIGNMFGQQSAPKPSHSFFESFNQVNARNSAFKGVYQLFEDLQQAANPAPKPKEDTFSLLLEEWNGKYLKILSDSFSSQLPDPLRSFVQDSIATHTMHSKKEPSLIESWTRDIEEIQKLLQDVSDGDTDAYTRFTRIFNSDFGKVCGTMFNLPQMAKNTELISLQQDSVNELRQLIESTSHFSTIVAQANQDTLQRVISRFQEQSANGKAPDTFEDFYSLWLNENQRALQRLLMNGEFYLLSNQVTHSGIRLRSKLEKLMSKQKELLAFPNSNEMDNLLNALKDLGDEVKRFSGE